MFIIIVYGYSFFAQEMCNHSQSVFP